MKTWVRSSFGILLSATVLALLVRLFLIEDYRISSASMVPGLLAGDLVFASKFDFNIRVPFSTYEIVKVRAPRHSEVVVFTLPDRGIETFVKRVVGIEGDRVAIQKGKLYVNGEAAKYESVPNSLDSIGQELEGFFGKFYRVIPSDIAAKDFGPIDIPKEHFFALGDNRPESVDSRTWGPVPYSCLKGKLQWVWASVKSDGGLRNGRQGRVH